MVEGGSDKHRTNVVLYVTSFHGVTFHQVDGENNIIMSNNYQYILLKSPPPHLSVRLWPFNEKLLNGFSQLYSLLI